MKTIRVLWMDHYPSRWCPDLSSKGLTIEAEEQILFQDIDHYELSTLVCFGIKELTQGDMYDAVVIGNNNDAGVGKAAYVAPKMKDRTIIVWNNYKPGDEAWYEQLGFKHFCSRSDLSSMIPKVLGIDT